MSKQNKKEFHFQTKINPESFPPTNCSVPGVLFFDDTVKEYFLKSKRPDKVEFFDFWLFSFYYRKSNPDSLTFQFYF